MIKLNVKIFVDVDLHDLSMSFSNFWYVCTRSDVYEFMTRPSFQKLLIVARPIRPQNHLSRAADFKFGIQNLSPIKLFLSSIRLITIETTFCKPLVVQFDPMLSRLAELGCTLMSFVKHCSDLLFSAEFEKFVSLFKISWLIILFMKCADQVGFSLWLAPKIEFLFSQC